MMMTFISINDLFAEFLKYTEIREQGNFEFIVISQTVVTSLRKMVQGTRKHRTISKYQNITFVPELFPSGECIEYMYEKGSKFKRMYKDTIRHDASMLEELCMIVDLMLGGKNVVLVTGLREYTTDIFPVINEIFFDQFQLTSHYYEEFKVDPKKLFNVGDVEEIKKRLIFTLKKLEVIEQDDDEYYNWMRGEDIEKYRQKLMELSVAELKNYATRHNVYANGNKPKAEIVALVLENITKGKSV